MKHFWKQFRSQPLGIISLAFLLLLILVGVYAPFFASSKPIALEYEGQWYFPLFRYLFFRGFYTTGLDLFFNLLMFTLPLALIAFYISRQLLILVALLQTGLFLYLLFIPLQDPSYDSFLTRQRLDSTDTHSWTFALAHTNDYAKLNEIIKYEVDRRYSDALKVYQPAYDAYMISRGKQQPIVFPTRYEEQLQHWRERSQNADAETSEYLQQQRQWLESQSKHITRLIMPLWRPFHWEDDTGGGQALNPFVHWWQLTRPGGKDLAAALLFGIRISIVVGLLAVSLALLIGIPIGAFAGYYGGWTDIAVSRLMEIWESMPTFFMLLFVVAILQTKSIFLVIIAIGFFGWTGFSRYVRGEFFKQRNLPYVETCRAMGFSNTYIMFTHILPNAIPPLLTLLPFAIMGAITTEAGLSFLGLGEEGSCSWGVLMDEGRQAFPSQSALMWPPAFLLTAMLIAIALVGDALRDALDPRLHRA